MSLPAYAQYQESGIAWLGNVPAQWSIQPFYSLASERNESNKGMLEDNLLSLSYGRVVRKDIGSNDGLLPESFETYQIVRAGDIIFRLTDLQNDKRSLRTARVQEDGIITSAYLSAIPMAIESRYLSYLLRSYDITKVFYSMGGGLRQSMKFSDIKRVPILVPSFNEQISIAVFLDSETSKIDALISEQEKLITLLAEKRQAIITHAVTKGLNPGAPMKDSGVGWLGEVPEHWSVSPIKYIARVGNGSTPNRDEPKYWSEGRYPWLNSSVVNQDKVTEADQFVTELALKECHLPIVVPPAVLVGITGQGRTRGMATTLLFEATINQHVVYIKPRSDSLNIDFLRRVFDMAYQYLRTESDSAGSTKGAITCDQILRLTIPFPCIDEQDKIVKFLDDEAARLDALTNEASLGIKLLHERRSALISAAVTGKIDVRPVVQQEQSRIQEAA